MASQGLTYGIVQGRLTVPPLGELQWFPQEGWEREFASAAALGFRYLELVSERQHNERNPLWTPSGIDRVLELQAASSLEEPVICEDFVVDHAITGEPEVVAHVRRCLAAASCLGVRLFVLPLFEASLLSTKTADRMVPVLTEIAELAMRSGITLCLESTMESGPFAEVMALPGMEAVRCVFDTGNRAHLSRDLGQEVRDLGASIAHVHLKDKDSAGRNVLLGTGAADFKGVFEALDEVGYAGRFTFETTRGTSPARTAAYNIGFATFFALEGSS